MPTMPPQRLRTDCSRRLPRSGRPAFAASTATSPMQGPRAGPTSCRNTPSYPSSSSPIRPERMRPTSPWSSTPWTCFIAAGSTDSAWCRQTAILRDLPPASGSTASMCMGSASRRHRKASGRPAEDSSIPRTCLAARRTIRMPPRGRSCSNPLMQPRPSSRRSSPRWKAKTAGSILGKSEKRLTNLAPDFDSRTFGSRKLSDLVRKTNAFEIEQPKAGGATRIRIKPLAGPPAKTRAARKPAG